MKTTIKIDAKLIRAAMACQAKGDVRYYLNGILLAKNGDIVGTDGHRLLKTFSRELFDANLESDVIVNIEGTINKTAETVEFCFHDLADMQADITATMYMPRTKKVFVCERIDGKYPEYARVVPTIDHRRAAAADPDNKLTPVTVNSEYLSAASVITGGVTIHTGRRWNSDAITLTPVDAGWPAGTILLIMPIRTDAVDIRPIDGGTPDRTDAGLAAVA